MRQHSIHRAKIIGQHQIIALHGAGQSFQSRRAGPALQGWKIDVGIEVHPGRDQRRCPQRTRHRRDNGMLYFIPNGIDKLDGAHFFAAGVEAGMEMQHPQALALLAWSLAHATLASSRSIAAVTAGSSRLGA